MLPPLSLVSRKSTFRSNKVSISVSCTMLSGIGPADMHSSWTGEVLGNTVRLSSPAAGRRVLSSPAAKRLLRFRPLDFTNRERQLRFFRVRIFDESIALKVSGNTKERDQTYGEQRNDKGGSQTRTDSL